MTVLETRGFSCLIFFLLDNMTLLFFRTTSRIRSKYTLLHSYSEDAAAGVVSIWTSRLWENNVDSFSSEAIQA